MIGRRAIEAGIGTKISCHSFRATGITEYLRGGGKLEVAQQMANHESARTTGLYDRRNDQVSLDEVERITFEVLLSFTERLLPMSFKQCVLCDRPITAENDSEEHIIPNSIGGRKTVKGFICKECNGSTGREWDAELARQLNSLSLFFGISRDRGEVPPQLFKTTTGEKLWKNADGSLMPHKPQYEENHTESGIQINVNARTWKETRKILKGITAKYPQLDFNEIMATAKIQYDYLEGMLKYNLQVGGHDFGRSIVKSALALAVKSDLDAISCEVARNYLINTDAEACFGYYYERDLIANRPDDVVLHCISVSGNPETRQLLGYVEYFGIHRMVVCLSSNYDGEEFSNTYGINPISSEELDLGVNLSLTPEDILATYRYEKIPEGSLEKAIHKVIPIGMKRSYEQELNRVVRRAYEHALKESGAKEGDVMTEELARTLSRVIAEQVPPFFLRMLRKPK